MSCPYCKKPREKMTSERFKTLFKVGDTIQGYSTGLQCIITAIGKERFLFTTGNTNNERVGKMDSYTSNWRPLK